MTEWGVQHSGPGPVRPCADQQHAQAVMAGLPAHYLPAEIVRRDGGTGWVATGAQLDAPGGTR